MKNAENPVGTNITDNLTSLKFLSIALAIHKNLCLASYLLYLFLERKEFLDPPFMVEQVVCRQPEPIFFYTKRKNKQLGIIKKYLKCGIIHFLQIVIFILSLQL